MPSIPLHPPPNPYPSTTTTNTTTTTLNPLPPLLHTPQGLALLEIQGSLNLPPDPRGLQIGRLEFPLLSRSAPDLDEPEGKRMADPPPWTTKVHLYIGTTQRLVGSVRALERPLAVVVRRKKKKAGASHGEVKEDEEESEALEVRDIVRWKLYVSF